jgi:hypothetical protein
MSLTRQKNLFYENHVKASTEVISYRHHQTGQHHCLHLQHATYTLTLSTIV